MDPAFEAKQVTLCPVEPAEVSQRGRGSQRPSCLSSVPPRPFLHRGRLHARLLAQDRPGEETAPQVGLAANPGRHSRERESREGPRGPQVKNREARWLRTPQESSSSVEAGYLFSIVISSDIVLHRKSFSSEAASPWGGSVFELPGRLISRSGTRKRPSRPPGVQYSRRRHCGGDARVGAAPPVRGAGWRER